VRYRSEFLGAVVDLWKKCSMIVPQNGYEGHRGWLNYLAVLPEHQGQGYGRKLVEKAIAELKKLGCLKVNLEVRKSNSSVIDFYMHLGFKDNDVVGLGKRLR
jgi:ribosomal protein S18 acetylase RimI-like enzyme